MVTEITYHLMVVKHHWEWDFLDQYKTLPGHEEAIKLSAINNEEDDKKKLEHMELGTVTDVPADNTNI